MKHTPGPWRAESNHIVARSVRVAVVDTTDIHAGVDAAEAEANTRLVVAAPDLLAALKEFSDYVHAEQCSTDGAVTYSNTQINRLAFLARSAIASAAGAA
jgi:hypothetical protein